MGWFPTLKILAVTCEPCTRSARNRARRRPRACAWPRVSVCVLQIARLNVTTAWQANRTSEGETVKLNSSSSLTCRSHPGIARARTFEGWVGRAERANVLSRSRSEPQAPSNEGETDGCRRAATDNADGWRLLSSLTHCGTQVWGHFTIHTFKKWHSLQILTGAFFFLKHKNNMCLSWHWTHQITDTSGDQLFGFRSERPNLSLGDLFYFVLAFNGDSDTSVYLYSCVY